ncbi:Hypothetical_protein [Hexamita inflata]|uniref:Hypothetical_protein n=1 Tax=Hexamita inflata TaxID=28002 RepID=A0AA86RL42_9EUKA|nr:Hypothetical protein HINF_LOCUS66327 [Hexamita inflata]
MNTTLFAKVNKSLSSSHQSLIKQPKRQNDLNTCVFSCFQVIIIQYLIYLFTNHLCRNDLVHEYLLTLKFLSFHLFPNKLFYQSFYLTVITVITLTHIILIVSLPFSEVEVQFRFDSAAFLESFDHHFHAPRFRAFNSRFWTGWELQNETFSQFRVLGAHENGRNGGRFLKDLILSQARKGQIQVGINVNVNGWSGLRLAG